MKKEKRKSYRPFIIIGVFVIILLLILLFCLRGCVAGEVAQSTGTRPIFNLTQDADAVQGSRETDAITEVQEALNRAVADGMINISMNMSPVFEDGTAKGNLLIVNEDVNRYPQVVEIYRDDTGELVYRSGLIPVGSRVDTAMLVADLVAGSYACTAYFNAVNSDTGELMGKAGAAITITILN